ncbi:alpha-L-fucosidase [Lentzea sp. NPDC006480]|uniref:alpha-L-fucosidase n=1 Tax=Lentzea sp. NPDC006480 TaxID=3157176 RepID=UPI0033B4AE12
MRRRHLAAVLVVLAAVLTPAAAADPIRYDPTRESLARHPLPDWYRDAKFGIFVHWGPYSVPAYGAPLLPAPADGLGYGVAEWYWLVQQIPGTNAWTNHLLKHGPFKTYDDFIPEFTAANFDPDAWVRLFEDAGARYFNLTAKHHDGFALWPSDTTGRDAGELGPRRDLVGELFDAAHRRGDRVKPGLYYSIPEWFSPAPQPLRPLDPAELLKDPVRYLAGELPWAGALQRRNAYTQQPVPYTGYRPLDDYAAGQVRPQLRELINRYHPNTLWCDIGGPEAYFKSNEVIADYYNQAPDHNPDGVVVDNRCGDKDTHRDYEVIERTTDGTGPPRPDAAYTEVASTMGHSWGYDPNDELASTDSLVDMLVNTVADNGNLLLNIGPKPDGSIPDAMAERLRGIGTWLRINGEAIYGSSTWTTRSEGDLRYTKGANGDLYATSLVWPGRELVITAPVDARRITLLGSDGTPLPFRHEGGRLVVTTPAGGDQHAATRSEHAFVFRIEAS